MAFNPRDQQRLVNNAFDPTEMVCAALNTGTPWDNIFDFATHHSFCNFPLFPRQVTLLKLIYLETENMTQYDIDVIEEWRRGFALGRDVFGVQPDIWQRIEYLKKRGYRRFPHIQMVLGRRASKGAIGGILGCEQVAYLHSKDNPQAYYGVAADKDVYLNVGATSQTQASQQLFADIRTMIERCKYFHPDGRKPWLAESKDSVFRVRTPADLRHIAELEAQGQSIDHIIASLVGVARSASSVAGRGQTSFANFYDEFAFHVQTGSSKSDTEIYKDWQPSLGQFDIDALTYIPSSPATKAGQFYVLYQTAKVLMSTYNDETGMRDEARQNLINVGANNELDCDPTWLIFQGSSWDLYRDWKEAPRLLNVGYWFPKAPEPDLTNERQIRERTRDPDKFRVEKLGQFAEVMDQYLDSDKIEAMFLPVPWREISRCNVCDDRGYFVDPKDRAHKVCQHPLTPQAYGTFDRKYRIHCDPGRTGANFALAIGHLEDAPPDEHGLVWPHVVFDYLHVWRPMDSPEDPETHKKTIDYVQVHSDIEDFLNRFRSTEKISFDQWNSASFIPSLRQKFMPDIRVLEITFAEKENQVRCEKFKSALNLGWVHAYRENFYFNNVDCLLELELKFLSEKNGKVVRQETGPVTTKDLADAAMVVTVDLLHDALDRWSSDRLTAGAYGSTDISGLKSGRELDRFTENKKPASEILYEKRALGDKQRRRGRYEADRLTSIHSRQQQRERRAKI